MTSSFITFIPFLINSRNSNKCQVPILYGWVYPRALMIGKICRRCSCWGGKQTSITSFFSPFFFCPMLIVSCHTEVLLMTAAQDRVWLGWWWCCEVVGCQLHFLNLFSHCDHLLFLKYCLKQFTSPPLACWAYHDVKANF